MHENDRSATGFLPPPEFEAVADAFFVRPLESVRGQYTAGAVEGEAVTAYLEALEALPYGFFWDRVSLDATQFPKITGSLVVYTVSLRQEWIGV
jgi:hypothetical protein